MKRLMVTSMSMSRFRLITKEKRDELYLGRKEMYKGSINDSIETLLGNIRLGNQPNEILNLYFTPRLTDEEMQLIDRKDPDYLQTFTSSYPDVNEASMKNSESDYKFCETMCTRKTESFQWKVINFRITKRQITKRSNFCSTAGSKKIMFNSKDRFTIQLDNIYNIFVCNNIYYIDIKHLIIAACNHTVLWILQ